MANDAGRGMGEDDYSEAARERRRRAASVYGRIGTLTSQARGVREARQRGREAATWGDPMGVEPSEAGPHGGAWGGPGAPGRTVPQTVREAAAWSWRMLVIGAVAYLLVRVLAMVPIVTIPFVVALLLTAVLAPVQRWLRDRLRVPHSLAAFGALLLGVGIISLIGWFVGTQVRTNAPRMASQLSVTLDFLATWVQRGPLQISDAQVEQYGEELQRAIAANQERLVSGALSTLSAVSHLLAGMLLLLLATFFLLRDGDRIWGWVLSLLPLASRARTDAVGRFGWRTLGGFMRGQTIIAFLHGSTVFVVLVVLQVPMALALSVLILVGSYIPILGMTVTGTLCVIVSLIEHGPAAAIVVAITIIVLIQLEAHLLQPLIMARTVEVHPLGVAMAVLAGTTLGGIAGALFAVPIVAFLNATIRAAHMPLRQDARGHAVVGPVRAAGQASDDRLGVEGAAPDATRGSTARPPSDGHDDQADDDVPDRWPSSEPRGAAVGGADRGGAEQGAAGQGGTAEGPSGEDRAGNDRAGNDRAGEDHADEDHADKDHADEDRAGQGGAERHGAARSARATPAAHTT